MPNIKSSKKSVKTDIVQTVANNEYAARVKNSIKKVEKMRFIVFHKNFISSILETKPSYHNFFYFGIMNYYKFLFILSSFIQKK